MLDKEVPDAGVKFYPITGEVIGSRLWIRFLVMFYISTQIGFKKSIILRTKHGILGNNATSTLPIKAHDGEHDPRETHEKTTKTKNG